MEEGRLLRRAEERSFQGHGPIEGLSSSASGEVIPSHDLLDEAFEIATEDRLTIYDSLFVAACEKTNAPLFTADRKLYERTRKRDDVVLL